VLTAKEAFTIGFVRRCIADGLPIDQVAGRVKEAAEKLALFGDVIKSTTNLAKAIAPVAFLAPPVVGGIGGYALSRATDLDDTEIDDIKKQELLDTYNLESAKLRRQKAFRDYNTAKNKRTRYHGG